MSERIKLLAEQADKWFEEDGHSYSRSAWNEKFVELIVRECADYISETATIETLLGERLKEHFGVEE